MSPPLVDVVVVSFNVRELLLACVRSVEEAWQAGEVDSITVVDCQSTDGSAKAIRAAFPFAEVIDAPNRGYGAAVNLGIARTTSPFVLALNPDTVVAPCAVRTLAAYLEQHPWTAIVGPRLVYPDGREQPTRRRFPTRLTPIFESTIFHRRWQSNPWASRYLMEDEVVSGAQTVDWIVGACLLMRRTALESCGGFDESFFLYSEELELCWRLRRHGWRVAWLPDALVTHHESASAGQDAPRRQLRFDASRVQLAEMMYGPATGHVVRAGLLAGYAVQLASESAKWLAGHRRDLRRERATMYAGLLRCRMRENRRP